MIKTDVVLSSGGYEAEFRSDLGGNCYRLRHLESGAEILRSPKSEEELCSSMYLFGNPILFPPNRIRGGSFTFEGREYRFPINEKRTGCHIHGELYKLPFTVSEITRDTVTFTREFKEGEYIGFPHAYSITRTYKLDASGLHERVEVQNLSSLDMPFMLAFHTTFNVPFADGGSGEECYAKIPVLKEHLRDDNYLPTLEYEGGRERERQLTEGSYRVLGEAISAFYEAFGGVTEIKDRSSGLSIVYEADEAYKYRMLWRGENSPFFVAEPQTAAIDCFHLEAPAAQKGLIVVAPGECFSLNTRIALEKTKKTVGFQL